MITGQKLRAIRKMTGWTQDKLAEKAGVHVNTIRNYENGRCDPVAIYEAALNAMGYELIIRRMK